MARKSDIQRALLGAISGGAGNIGYQWEQQRRAQMVEDQRAAEAAERERQRIDAEGRAYGRQILPQSPPLGTPMGGVIPQGMPGMTAGGLEDAIRMAQYQRAQQALLPEPADPLADLKLQHERAQLEWDLANMGADPVLERQKALVDYKNSLGDGAGGGLSALDRGRLQDTFFGTTSAGGTWTPGTALTGAAYDTGLQPEVIGREWLRGQEAGTVNPFSQAAADSIVQANMFQEVGGEIDLGLKYADGEFVEKLNWRRDRALTRLQAAEKIREKMEEAIAKKRPLEYADIKATLIGLGMEPEEARQFLFEVSKYSVGELPKTQKANEDQERRLNAKSGGQ